VQVGFPIDMQCDPRDPNRIFVNNYGGGNFLSEDGGRTWRNASQGYTGERAYSVAVDPNNPGRVYSAGFGGAWRSDNGGTTWSGLYHPLPDYTIGFETVAADPSRSGHVLAGDVGTFESFDSGESWALRWSLEQIATELPEDATADQTPSAIVFAPSHPQTVYIGFGPQGCVNGHEPACWRPGAGVVVSRDGGASWRHPMSEELHGLSVIDLAVDPDDDQVVYAATGIGLFKSTDGGGNWTALSGLPEEMPVRAVAVSPADSQYVLAGIDGVGVYISHDGGSTWREGVAGLEPNGSLHDIVFDPMNPQVVYTSDQSSGVYRSLDGGQSWVRINNGLRSRAVMGLAVSRDGQYLYVGTYGDGVYRLDLNGVPPQPVEQAVEQPTSVELGQTVEPPEAEPLASEPEPIEQVAEEPTSVEPGQTVEAPEAEPLAPEPEPEVRHGLLYLAGALLLLVAVGLIWLRYRRR
jgi:photosystem II stability/assembly factor-like uncharacterized protein